MNYRSAIHGPYRSTRRRVMPALIKGAIAFAIGAAAVLLAVRLEKPHPPEMEVRK